MTTTISKSVSAASNEFLLSGALSFDFESNCETKVEDNLYKDMKVVTQGAGDEKSQAGSAPITLLGDFKFVVHSWIISGQFKSIPSGDTALTRKQTLIAMAESGIFDISQAVFSYEGKDYKIEFKQLKFIENPGAPNQYQYAIEIVEGASV